MPVAPVTFAEATTRLSHLGAELQHARRRGDGPAIERYQFAVAAEDAALRALLRVDLAYNPDQPRDSKGRWGSEGITSEQIHGAPEGSPVWNMLGGHPTSEDAYRRADGTYTPERAQLHQDFIHKMVDGIPTVEHPTVFAMGGGGGAGKSYILDKGVVDVPEKGQAARINADDVKEWLPEYKPGLEVKDKTAAAALHEESSTIAKAGIHEALTSSKHAVVDAVLDTNADTVAAKVAGWRKDGAQRVEATYVTVPIKVALTEARKRGERTGRVVPPDVLKDAHRSVATMFPKLLDKAPFDKLTLVENVRNGPPKVLLTQENGVTTVHDKKGYSAFLRRGY